MARPIGVIQNSGPLINLLKSLGVNRPPTPFTLDGDVVPVILVDSAISFVAAPTPPYRVTDIFTNGVIVAPPVNTILADTGPLLIGSYSIKFFLRVTESNQFNWEWRDVANTANLWQQQMAFLADQDGMFIWENRLEIQNDGERFRFSNITAGAVGAGYQATILART